jgi:hypothetical protein
MNKNLIQELEKHSIRIINTKPDKDLKMGKNFQMDVAIF